jgi:hypothetical protein
MHVFLDAPAGLLTNNELTGSAVSVGFDLAGGRQLANDLTGTGMVMNGSVNAANPMFTIRFVRQDGDAAQAIVGIPTSAAAFIAQSEPLTGEGQPPTLLALELPR